MLKVFFDRVLPALVTAVAVFLAVWFLHALEPLIPFVRYRLIVGFMDSIYLSLIALIIFWFLSEILFASRFPFALIAPLFSAALVWVCLSVISKFLLFVDRFIGQPTVSWVVPFLTFASPFLVLIALIVGYFILLFSKDKKS